MRAKPTPEQAPYFLPARLGGIGAGFTRGRDKEASKVYLSAHKPRNSLSDTPDTSYGRMSPDAPKNARKAIDAETVRARARVVTLGLLNRLHRSRDSMDDAKVIDALNATGKLSGAIATSVDHKHSHRLLSGEERERRAAEIIQRVQARLLIEGPDVSQRRTDSEPTDAIPLPDNDIG